MDFVYSPNWLCEGPLEARRRLWRVVLPTVEKLPRFYGFDDELEPEFVDAVVEHGAPHVRRLTFYGKAPQGARCLAHMQGLEALVICNPTTEFGEVLEAAMAATGGGHGFIPMLQRLGVTECSDSQAGRRSSWGWGSRGRLGG
jgi:hypothetical protein